LGHPCVPVLPVRPRAGARMLSECPFWIGEAWKKSGDTRSFAFGAGGVPRTRPPRSTLDTACHQTRLEGAAAACTYQEATDNDAVLTQGPTGPRVVPCCATQILRRSCYRSSCSLLRGGLGAVRRRIFNIVAHSHALVCEGNVPAAVRGGAPGPLPARVAQLVYRNWLKLVYIG